MSPYDNHMMTIIIIGDVAEHVNDNRNKCKIINMTGIIDMAEKL